MLYRHIANSFLKLGNEENIELTQMKLQKLMYFFYKKYLIKTENVPFNQKFEAWKYGPVLDGLYNQTWMYRANPISEYLKDEDGNMYAVADYEKEIWNTINEVWRELKQYSGIELSQFTHKKDSAWHKAWKEYKKYIPVKYILEEDDIVG